MSGLFSVGLECRGLGGERRKSDLHSYSLGAQVLGKDTSQLLDCALGRDVQGVGWCDARGGAERCGEHDNVGALGEVGECFLCGVVSFKVRVCIRG